ncbi:peptidoglycan hydrolase-like protein with peptidoglycan-binding domain [Bradyrhizobium sp. USDA 10063]
MAKALSVDLRQRWSVRLTAACPVDRRAERFGVSAASAIRWRGRLKEVGIARRSGWEDVFGPHTEAAVRVFQASHVDFDGNPLKVDGIVVPKTWIALWS